MFGLAEGWSWLEACMARAYAGHAGKSAMPLVAAGQGKMTTPDRVSIPIFYNLSHQPPAAACQTTCVPGQRHHRGTTML